MRRIRHEFTLYRAADSRLGFAVVLSAAVHVFLICSLAPRPGNPSPSHSNPIHARLMPVQAAPMAIAQVSAPAVLPDAVAGVFASAAAAAPAESGDAVPPAPAQAVNPVVDMPDLPGLSDPVHYAAKDLDIYPRLERALHPDYPDKALQQRIPGTVTLLVLIDEAGKVTETSVIDAVPEGVFDESARMALSAAGFVPAQRDGRRVRSRILVNLNYDPDGVEQLR